ncbi:MAG TPA: hypothetical protein VFS60_15705 [Thermoanaerobaculia bacterium]|nr:hypothetical protein [Thermoanaerobaculia bacterium]
MRALDWPALQAAASLLGEPLVVERAVWGKAHAASSDYRWIARSAGFDLAFVSALEKELNLGTEDQPERAVLWRAFGDRCHAVACYESRAIDNSGRVQFLEKQILQWRRPAGVPAALGALVLLPATGKLSDEIWWPQRNALTDPGVVLPIAPEDHQPVVWDEASLGASVDAGREWLGRSVAVGALERFYADLLAQHRPAVLADCPRPPPPAALAALLLPLPVATADGTSLAGWIPSSRCTLSDLAHRWEGLVLPPRTALPEHPPASEVLRSRGWTMAHSLVEDPSLLSPFDVGEARVAAAIPARGPVARGARSPPVAAVAAPPGAGDSGRPTHEVSLETPPRAWPLLVELHQFAAAADRRWLAPDALRTRLRGDVRPWLDHEATTVGELLARWIAQLESARPPHAHREQWQVKLDLLRSAALSFAPGPSTWELVGLPRGDRVPAFLLAIALDDRRRDDLARLGDAALRAMQQQTADCKRSPWSKRVRAWLQLWRDHTRQDLVRRTIDLRTIDHSTGKTASSSGREA